MTTKNVLDPRAGLSPDADRYVNPANGMHSRAYDLAADGILSAEASSLFHRAALASAEGRNDDRDEMEKQARKLLRSIVSIPRVSGVDLTDAAEQSRRDFAEANRDGVRMMMERGKKPTE